MYGADGRKAAICTVHRLYYISPAVSILNTSILNESYTLAMFAITCYIFRSMPHPYCANWPDNSAFHKDCSGYETPVLSTQTKPVPRTPQQILPPEKLHLILPPPCIGVRLDQKMEKQPEQPVGVRIQSNPPLAAIFKTESIPKHTVSGHATILKQPSPKDSPGPFRKHWAPKRKRRLTVLPIIHG